jgi:hypothetical protein
MSVTVALDGCGNSSVTSREEHRPRVYENRVLRRISGPKKREIIGDLKSVQVEELQSLCS